MQQVIKALVQSATGTLFNRIATALILFSFAIPATALAIVTHWSPMK